MMESDGCSVKGADPHSPGRFYHNCDTAPGMSGGPIVAMNSIIGIESAAFFETDDDADKFNKAVVMTENVIKDINATIKKEFPPKKKAGKKAWNNCIAGCRGTQVPFQQL